MAQKKNLSLFFGDCPMGPKHCFEDFVLVAKSLLFKDGL
jgi:hypothetical protein